MNVSFRVPVFAATLLCLASLQVAAHENHDHSGASLATEQPATLGAPIHLPKATQFLMGVKTTPAVEETLPRRHKALGRIVLPPSRQAEVRAPFEGLIVYSDRITIPEPGSWVEAGAVLALLEQAIGAPQRVSLAAEIASTQTDLELAKEEAHHTELELDRVKALGDAASDRRLVETRAEYNHAALKVEGLQSKLVELRAAQSATESNPRLVPLRAPISGIVAATRMTPGEFVSPERLLVDIVDPGVVWVEADIYERDLPLVRNVSRAVVRTQAYSEALAGRIHHVSPRFDPDTRTAQVVFEVENPGHLLREGMFVDVGIESEETETGLMVPKASVVDRRGISIVYVKTGAESFVAREVHVAGIWDDRYMIESGLQPGDVVVTQGTYQVRAAAASSQAPQPMEESSLEHGHEH